MNPPRIYLETTIPSDLLTRNDSRIHNVVSERSRICESTMNSHLPLRLCAFARGNLHTPSPTTTSNSAANSFIPIKSYPAQRLKGAKFFKNQEADFLANRDMVDCDIRRAAYCSGLQRRIGILPVMDDGLPACRLMRRQAGRAVFPNMRDACFPSRRTGFPPVGSLAHRPPALSHPAWQSKQTRPVLVGAADAAPNAPGGSCVQFARWEGGR